ncbi:hypothetical protein [Microterricola viridarii]|uniref:ABC transporter domain-containing protein n=1 Tax=Microterricola viridarii TaxID=412690 RepID=A0A1H1NH48_9MICO|nr:hypothetical protein [Microterricola viridarii]SDR98272.1 hypothetical protein SAMN04489834_0640 [Microterricola viridarii]
MLVTLDMVSKGRDAAALPPLSARYRTGSATLVAAETERRPAVLALIASGRMRPDAGVVRIDGAVDNAQLRRRVAVIDAPEVNDPVGEVTLSAVVAEELMFAGRPSHPLATSRMLATLQAAEWGRQAIADVPPQTRIHVLTELAVLRAGVQGLVLTAPDRHGGDPQDWWRIAQGLAGRGLAVLVVCGTAAKSVIDAAETAQELAAAGDFEDSPTEVGQP